MEVLQFSSGFASGMFLAYLIKLFFDIFQEDKNSKK